MKRYHKILFGFGLVALGLSCFTKAQHITTPQRPAGPSYYNPDPDAANYLEVQNISDPYEIRYMHQWYAGLKSLNIYSSTLYMLSLRSEHKALSGSTVTPMIGGTTVTIGTVTNYTGGAVFDGTGNNWIRITNTFGASLTNFTLVAAFRYTDKLAYHSVFGGYDDSAPHKGPQMWIDGNPNLGYGRNLGVLGWSGNGTTNGTVISAGKQAFGGPQLLIASFSPTSVSLKSTLGKVSRTAVTGYGPADNQSTYWSIGRMTTTSIGAMLGEVAFVMLINKHLTDAEQNELRKLYTRTIGQPYIPRINMFLEGDSYTAGAASETTWRQHLATNAIWGNYVVQRNVSVSGALITDALTRWTNDVSKFAIDADYATRQYYVDFIGNNNINVLDTNAPNTLMTSKKFLWSSARNAGMKVIVFTGFMTTNTFTNATYRLNWTNYNNLIINNRPLYDVLVRVDQDPRLQDFGNTTYFQNDFQHPNTLGHKVIEQLFNTALPYP